MNKLTLMMLLWLVVSFGNVQAQKLDYVELPSNSTQKMSVVKVIEKDDGMRVFVTSKEVVTSMEVEDLKITILEVLDFNAEGQSQTVGKHVLHNKAFHGYKFNLKRGRTSFGNQDDVMTYTALQEMYPELADVDYLDSANRKMPVAFYRSTLNTGAFKPKVKGFSSVKYSSDASAVMEKPKKKKKKGLMNKLASAAESVNKLDNKLNKKKQVYQVVEEVDVNWEDQYNGGQDKKNFWKSLASMSSQANGNVLAVNAKKVNKDATHEQMNKEIVVFSPMGEVVTRKEWTTEVPWIKIGTKERYAENADKAMDIDFLALAFKQNASKKQNPNCNKKQIAVSAIGADGSFLYDHIYDLPEDFSRMDTILTRKGQKTVLMGKMRNGQKFVAVSTPQGQKLHTVSEDAGVKGDVVNYFTTKSGEYAVYANKSLKTKTVQKYYLCPVSADGMGEPMTIPVNLKNGTDSRIDVLIDETDRTIIQTKQMAKGINDFKTVLTLPTLYELTDSGMTQITNLEDNMMTMNNAEVRSNTKVYKTNDASYFVAKIFRPCDNGDKCVTNALMKLTY